MKRCQTGPLAIFAFAILFATTASADEKCTGRFNTHLDSYDIELDLSAAPVAGQSLKIAHAQYTAFRGRQVEHFRSVEAKPLNDGKPVTKEGGQYYEYSIDLGKLGAQKFIVPVVRKDGPQMMMGVFGQTAFTCSSAGTAAPVAQAPAATPHAHHHDARGGPSIKPD